MTLSLETLSNVFSISVPATHAEIGGAERFLNCSLAADYKDFLLMTNSLESAGVKDTSCFGENMLRSPASLPIS